MSDSNIDANIELVKTFIDTIGRKEYDEGLKMVSADCEYTNVPLATVQGPEGIRAVLEPFFAPTITNEFVWKQVVEKDGVILAERLDRHQLADKWVELPVAGVFMVKDGLITVWRDYFDAAMIMKEWPTG